VSRRVLVIGLDMADADLVDAWARDGTLPNLRALMADGSWGRLRTTADVLHTSVWPTIFTGALPGKHGVYYPYQPCPGEQTARAIGPDQYGQPPFWTLLDRAGRQCVIFDAPETFPVDDFTGLQIFEWSTWAWYWRRMTTPPRLEGELRQRFGPAPLRLEARKLGLSMPDVQDLGRQLLEGAAAKARVARWLIRARPWDLFLVVFAEPHPAGHYLWPGDARPERASAGDTDEQGSKSLRAVYAAVDTAIGEVVEACGNDVTVVVVSGDGVNTNHCGWHLLPEVLRRSGFTRTIENEGRRSLLHRLRDGISPRARAAISSRLPWWLRDRVVSRLATANVDWSRSMASCLPTDLEGCIRINLKGREPQGIVEAGAHYDDVCADMTQALRELINPASGEPAVRSVLRMDQYAPGERRHHLPDLVVTWNSDAELQALCSDRVGVVRGIPVDPRPGTHHPRSFIAARGPGVRSGPLGTDGHIVDVAPTVLSWLGLPPPDGMDGRVLPAMGA
jgi:predicted AlkP superfamily phosphohydrolase/phosphomutase